LFVFSEKRNKIYREPQFAIRWLADQRESIARQELAVNRRLERISFLNNDERICLWAQELKNEGAKVLLLSNDINVHNRAMARKIPCMKSDEILEISLDKTTFDKVHKDKLKEQEGKRKG